MPCHAVRQVDVRFLCLTRPVDTSLISDSHIPHRLTTRCRYSDAATRARSSTQWVSIPVINATLEPFQVPQP